MIFFKKHRKKILWGGLILLALFFVYSRVQAKRLDKPENFNTAKDTIIKPEYKNIKNELILSGSIYAQDIAEVRFQTSGRLAWVGVKEGDRVKKWQSLSSLDKQELRKQLEISFNNYRSELSRFDDTQDKYKKEKEALILTDEMERILVRSQNSLDNSVINYELNDLAVKYATIWSPINGIVTKIEQPHPGVNITPANATITIIDPNSIYFKSEIDEADIPKVKIGQKATLNIDIYPEETITSQVTQIAFLPVTGQSSTVYKIDFQLPTNNSDLKYRLGMGGNVTLVLEEAQDALTVSVDALHQENDQYFLWIKPNGGNLEKRNVQIGIENDEDVQILEGLSPDEQVVIKSN